MIRHIFKIIWNERKTNAWIALEYVLVFCVLWFCVDYLYYMGRCYLEPTGFDMENTYQIKMNRKPAPTGEEAEKQEPIDKPALALTFMERVKNYPGVENVSFSLSATPFGWSNLMNGYYVDTISTGYVTLRLRQVTESFFDVFKMNTTCKNWDSWGAPGTNPVVIAPRRNGRYGDSDLSMQVAHVRKITSVNEDSTVYNVIGITDKLKDSYFEHYFSNMIVPLPKEKYDLQHMQLFIRVKPDAGKDFARRFTRDMREQLMLGPYFLGSIQSSDELKKVNWPAEDLNGIYAITVFLILNIFLGIIGTFWYRTEARRSEIGLRLALGSTKQGVKKLIFGETVLLLFAASLVGVNICLNIGQTEMLGLLGIPIANRASAGVGVEQDFINYGLTFGLLALISLIAVWYPARQAARIPPAEALRDE